MNERGVFAPLEAVETEEIEYIKPEQYRERREVNKEYGIGYQRGKDILYITH